MCIFFRQALGLRWDWEFVHLSLPVACCKIEISLREAIIRKKILFYEKISQTGGGGHLVFILFFFF